MTTLPRLYVEPPQYPRSYQEATVLDDLELKGLLVKHLKDHSVRRGDFTLKSGRKSSWFIDAKKTACDPMGIIVIAALMLRLIPAEVTGIGGLTMGADPVAFGVAAIASATARPISSFSVRKEVKDHGAGGRLAGILATGSTVAITEDAVTRGNSIMEAVDVVHELGGKVGVITAVVDRGGTVGALAELRGIPFCPLVTAMDLGFEFEGA